MVSLRFYFSGGIQYCIALSDFESNNFSNIMREIIKKSLFTERQIEIILKHKQLLDTEFPVSKGAYYRQVGQSRQKVEALYYSIILLQGLGVMLPNDDVISRLVEQVSVINNNDFVPENYAQILEIIHGAVKQMTGL